MSDVGDGAPCSGVGMTLTHCCGAPAEHFIYSWLRMPKCAIIIPAHFISKIICAPGDAVRGCPFTVVFVREGEESDVGS